MYNYVVLHIFFECKTIFGRHQKFKGGHKKFKGGHKKFKGERKKFKVGCKKVTSRVKCKDI